MAIMDIHKWDIGLPGTSQSRTLMLNGDALDPGETNFTLTAEQALDIGIALIMSTMPVKSHDKRKALDRLLHAVIAAILELRQLAILDLKQL